jgi:hypothetical protein
VDFIRRIRTVFYTKRRMLKALCGDDVSVTAHSITANGLKETGSAGEVNIYNRNSLSPAHTDISGVKLTTIQLTAL